MVRFINQADYAPGSLQPLGPGLGDVLASVFSARRAAEAQRREEARQATLDKAKIEEAEFKRAQSEIDRQLQLRGARIKERTEFAGITPMAQAPSVSATSQGIPEIGPEEAGPAASELVVPERKFTEQGVVDPRTGQELMPAMTFPLKYQEDIAREKEQEKIASGDLVRVTDEMRASLPSAFRGFTNLPRTTLERFETQRQTAETAKEAARVAQEGRKEIAAIAAGGREEARAERAAERATGEAAKKQAADENLDAATQNIISGSPLASVQLPPGQKAIAEQRARQAGARVYASPEDRAKVTDFDDLRGKAVRLRELLSDKQVQQFVGPVAGRLTGLASAIPGVPLPPAVEEARSLMGDLTDTELRRRSGAGTGAGEYERIRKFSVDPNGKLGVNLQNVGRMIDSIDSRIETLTGVRPGGKKAGAPEPKGGGGPAAPKVGTVEDGYRFKGGNPNDPNSWEKV